MTAIATNTMNQKPPFQIFLENLAEKVNDLSKQYDLPGVKWEIVTPADNLICCDIHVNDKDEEYPVYRMTVRKYTHSTVVRLTNLDDNHCHTCNADPQTVLQIISF